MYVGKREQSDVCQDGTALKMHASRQDLLNLSSSYAPGTLARIEMIDALWIESESIVGAFEVEYSTDFISAIQRGSNLSPSIPKFMIIPTSRESELLAITDPLFRESFTRNGWRYVLLPDLSRLSGFSRPSLKELSGIAKGISIG